MVKCLCPFCNKEVEVQERKVIEEIKDLNIEYTEKFYYCLEDDEEFYDEELSKENYINATDEYKKAKGLLTSKEIKEIREKYSLSQSDIALILGMGQITVTRYETGIIQEKTHDILLRIVNDEPHYLVELLSESKLPQKKRNKIKEAIINCSENKDKMIDNILGYDYYSVSDVLCGNNSFNKEKVFNCFSMIIESGISLTKTKAAKLLFYIDFLMYKKYNCSVTGIAYFHMPFGALPLSFDQIYRYSNLKITIEHDGDIEKQIITDVSSNNCLRNDEKEIVSLVINKFQSMNTNQIVEYMHNEVAYKLTENNTFIDYSYSKHLKDF